MKKLLLIITLLLITTNSYARYQLYQMCKNSSDTMSCSGTCKKAEGFTMDFKIDKLKNIVLRTTYYIDKSAGYKDVKTDSLDNCKVIDNSNWICRTENETTLRDRIVTPTFTQGMTNGNYYSYSDLTVITLSNTKTDWMGGSCSPKSLSNLFN